MKKVKLLFVVLFAASIVGSCNKEEVAPKQNNSKDCNCGTVVKIMNEGYTSDGVYLVQAVLKNYCTGNERDKYFENEAVFVGQERCSSEEYYWN